MLKRFTCVVLVAGLVLSGCQGGSPSNTSAPDDIIEPMPSTLPNDNHTDTPSAVIDISHIPYYGNREIFRLSAEHALAYADAIMSAEVDSDYWGHFSFDEFYPVLIDVSGDGVPLLLLAEKDNTDRWTLPMYATLLFGYADGKLQKITELHGIGIWTTAYENLLSIMRSGYRSEYNLYQVSNGAAKWVSTKTYESFNHPAVFRIDDVEVSEEEYWEFISELPMEYLMRPDHPGNIYATSVFIEYLAQPITREQAAQIFAEHANVLN